MFAKFKDFELYHVLSLFHKNNIMILTAAPALIQRLRVQSRYSPAPPRAIDKLEVFYVCVHLSGFCAIRLIHILPTGSLLSTQYYAQFFIVVIAFLLTMRPMLFGQFHKSPCIIKILVIAKLKFFLQAVLSYRSSNLNNPKI